MLTCSAALGAEIKREEGTLPSQFPYQISVPGNWNRIVINDLDAVANKDGKLAAYLLNQATPTRERDVILSARRVTIL